MKRCVSLVILGLLFPQFLSASDTANQQEAISRLEQAVAKTNIFELPSFAMKADVQLEDRGKAITGTYQLLWNGPDQWREEISLPGYSEVQIGGKATIWVQRSADFIPFPVYNLYQALGFGTSVGSPHSWSLVQLALTTKDRIKKTHARKEHGDKLTCFEIEDEQKHSSEICVHDRSGTLARDPSFYADSNLQPVGGKVFPRLLTMHRADEVMAKVDVSELSTPAQFPPNTFTPPSGIPPQAGCMNPSPPRLIKMQRPEYPPFARQQRYQGTVAFDALIGTDGVPRIRNVVQSAGPDLEASSLRALSQWRFDPALCSGQPVDVETVLEFNYTLSH
jgi:TonB family protein